MNTIGTVVTSSRRRGGTYLAACLDALPFGCKVVVYDTHHGQPHRVEIDATIAAGVSMVLMDYPTRAAAYRDAVWAALAMLDVDAIMIVEDDAVFVPDAWIWLAGAKLPEFASLWCSARYQVLVGDHVGWLDVRPDWLAGSVATLWQPDTLRSMAHHVQFARWPKMYGIDQAIGTTLDLMGVPVRVLCPGIVQHVGNVSTRPNQGIRREGPTVRDSFALIEACERGESISIEG